MMHRLASDGVYDTFWRAEKSGVLVCDAVEGDDGYVVG